MPESREVYAIRLDQPAYGQDVVHDACVHILAQKKKFANWLESGDDDPNSSAEGGRVQADAGGASEGDGRG